MVVTSTVPGLKARAQGIGAGIRLLGDPTGYFQSCRHRYGNTFRLNVFGHQLLCLFSPQGVQELWALPEASASKGLADLDLLAHKVPDELFAGRRTFPHTLFGRDDVGVYLDNVEEAVDRELAELGDTGEVELFALTRRLGHRVGLASWGGLRGDANRYFEPIVNALDRLDSAESFVHPHRAFLSIVTGKRDERRALHELDRLFGQLVSNREPRHEESGVNNESEDLFDRICQGWSDTSGLEREQGIARDVVLVHMGSQSNLFAATAWLIVHLLQRPKMLAQVREASASGDYELLERCAHETIRLRQRSIVLRKVLRPVQINDGQITHEIEPGAYLATMMSATNCSAAANLTHFEPANYRGARFLRSDELPARELVTTFGHGRHSCPAQGFSIASMRSFVAALFEHFELEARFQDPQPLKRQLGGVARADRPCLVGYRRRS